MCGIADALAAVGDRWSLLIVREIAFGVRRFNDIRHNTGAPRETLTTRLRKLEEAGVVHRRRYSERPPRDEYRLTERGRDFRPVVLALLAWGNRHFAPEGLSVMLVDKLTGAPAEPVLVDRVTGQPITDASHNNAAGPAAGARVKARLAKPRGTRSQDRKLG